MKVRGRVDWVSVAKGRKICALSDSLDHQCAKIVVRRCFSENLDIFELPGRVDALADFDDPRLVFTRPRTIWVIDAFVNMSRKGYSLRTNKIAFPLQFAHFLIQKNPQAWFSIDYPEDDGSVDFCRHVGVIVSGGDEMR